jgi:hypothetical protein
MKGCNTCVDYKTFGRPLASSRLPLLCYSHEILAFAKSRGGDSLANDQRILAVIGVAKGGRYPTLEGILEGHFPHKPHIECISSSRSEILYICSLPSLPLSK